MVDHKSLFSRSPVRNSAQHAPAIQNTTPHTSISDLVSLQRVIGNHALQRLIAEGNLPAALGVQAKLQVGAAHDTYEQEADQVASQVMRMSDTSVQRAEEEDELQMKRADIQRESESDEDESISMKRADIQRQEVDMMGAFEVGGSIERQIDASSGSGQSLPESTRDFLEPRFGHDFSTVNVHADGESDSLNRSMQARAFTKGSDIYFASGEYQPDSDAGRELLAHELTHVIQQTGGSPR